MEEAAVQGSEGAGATLHAERRRQSLSLGDVSRQLKLSVRQVEALERDDFTFFGGPVFVHGFVRNYAKLLGLDPEPLLRAADEKLAPAVTGAEEVREPVAVRAPSASPRRGLIGVIAGLLVLGIVLGVLGLNERKPVVKAPPAATLEAQEPKTVAPEAPPAQSPPGATPAPETAAATDVKTGTIRMSFEQESWVEIKDRSGNIIFGQLNPAGSRRRATGEPPLQVVIGNAAGVRLTYNDREIDLAPHTRVDVARLTLD
jgi:cytoskeleton protein RodZ